MLALLIEVSFASMDLADSPDARSAAALLSAFPLSSQQARSSLNAFCSFLFELLDDFFIVLPKLEIFVVRKSLLLDARFQIPMSIFLSQSFQLLVRRNIKADAIKKPGQPWYLFWGTAV